MTFRDSGAETTEVTARGGSAKGASEARAGVGEGPRREGSCGGRFLPPPLGPRERRLRLAGPALSPGPLAGGRRPPSDRGGVRGAGASCPPGAEPHSPVRGRGASQARVSAAASLVTGLHE